MSTSRHTFGRPRLLAAGALTVALTATGITAAKDPAGAAPGSGMVPAMSTVNPSTWTGSGTPVPTVPTSPSQSPLAPPTEVAVTGVTATSVTLTWTAPVRGEVTGYAISYIRRFNDVIQGIAVGNVTTATITGLTPAWDYTISLSAVDAAGNRSYAASPITVVTPLSDAGPDTTPPSTPTDFRVGPGAVLSWEPSTDNVGVTGYNVYYFDGFYQNRLVATVTGTSYTVVGTPSSPYPSKYYVRARDAAGNVSIATQGLTASGSTSPPPPPPACQVTYRTTAEWKRGFVAEMTITNTGQTPVDGWTLTFTFEGDQRITSTWNSTFTQDGASVTMKNGRRNARIAPGASTTVGIIGTFRYNNAPPWGRALNGHFCIGG
ncbi:MAG TPA: cellulose binding domain-containing protein [Actinoplanes sp.]|jgi:endoglucanase/cellulose 1,4-beta-cellobiosidase